ncbi:unnamed protein product [Effrenium voratum]|uniref:U-box domain-containing protein n=2 Tax=Effrenium voratum TaxID=2562239 RepID=A0AA36HJS4_9DINO|nr:unnamed protein product [Effrenium voratum]
MRVRPAERQCSRARGKAVLGPLQAAAGAGLSSGPPPELAARTCEAVVRVLRLLARSDLVWPSKILCNACSFLALASMLRAFQSAVDVNDVNSDGSHGKSIFLAPGQVVAICGLRSLRGAELNGARAQVRAFHADSGRYIVSLNEEDPPSEWKKLRVENLKADSDTSNASLALAGARECGKACLEAVAEIFDDLLFMMHQEESDEMCLALLHAQLASTMWEALVCCAGPASLPASAVLDLSGDIMISSLFARHVFSVHLTAHAAQAAHAAPQDQAATVRRLLTLQESFAEAYCRLYQPDAHWGPRETDESIHDLQESLDAHILRVASAAVQMGVLPQLIDCCDFHLAISPQPSATLPVLLSRLVCIFASRDAMLQRHIILLTPAILAVAESFVEAGEAGARHGLSQVLDGVIAVSQLSECSGSVEALTARSLQSEVRHDPAVLSRLALAHPGSPWVHTFASFSGKDKAVFWQHAQARSCLLRHGEEVLSLLQELCGETPEPSSPIDVSDALPPNQHSFDDGQIVEVIASVEEACLARGEAPEAPAPPSLSALDLPRKKDRIAKRLGRSDLARLRGVDLAAAPEDLRCAIDGKVLGAPVQSPYGHIFEQDTLRQWLATCGSVCPITGQPLREEDCMADTATQQKVLEWVKATRASHKERRRPQPPYEP